MLFVHMKNLFTLGILLVFAACSQQQAAGSYGQKFENKDATSLSTALASYNAGKTRTGIILPSSFLRNKHIRACSRPLATKPGRSYRRS